MDGIPTARPSIKLDVDQALVGEFSVRDVAELLAISAQTVRRCARDGLVSARRAERGQYRFRFDEIIRIRELIGLLAEASPRRVRRALHQVRVAGQSEGAGVRIRVEAGRLVAFDERGEWNPLSGQSLLDLAEPQDARHETADGEGAEIVEFPKVSHWPADQASLTSDDWFRLAYECESEGALEGALEAYGRAIALDATHLDAALNLGRLLHQAGRLAEAEEQYRQVLDSRPEDSLAAFNLGVLLEDQDRVEEALCAYELAIQHDPEHADAHYNAARLFQASGKVHRALWHFQVYRNLTR